MLENVLESAMTFSGAAPGPTKIGVLKKCVSYQHRICIISVS